MELRQEKIYNTKKKPETDFTTFQDLEGILLDCKGDTKRIFSWALY